MTMTSAPVTTRAQNGTVPEDNPAARPKRRQFSADYKLAILEEYERITEDGGKGALLRREGLYSSHIVEWQRARDVGALSGLAPKHRKKRSAAERELDLLRRRNAKLEDQLARHRVALEAQGTDVAGPLPLDDVARVQALSAQQGTLASVFGDLFVLFQDGQLVVGAELAPLGSGRRIVFGHDPILGACRHR